MDTCERTYKLAIAIPAYGRASAIKDNLTAMIMEARTLDVGFYVSDDTPDTSVEDVVKDLAGAGYPIHYRRNSPGLGHDANVLMTLLWPNAEYIWPMNSALQVADGQFGKIISFLAGQDLVFVNEHSDDFSVVPAIRGDEARSLIRGALWHQTLTGATIYNRRVCEWVRAQGADFKVVTNFPHLCVIMGFASDYDAVVGWLGDRVVVTTVGRRSYWVDRAIDVFVDDWATVINRFPVIVPQEHRADAIREHSARMNLFNALLLMELRKSGQFGWSSFRSPSFRAAMHLPLWKVALLMAAPLLLVDPILRTRARIIARRADQ